MFASPRANREIARDRIAALPHRARKGAILSTELLLVLPVLIGVCLAVVEFAMLLSARQQVKTACQVACRVGTLPAANPSECEEAVRAAAKRALARKRLIEAHELEFTPGRFAGDDVVVEIRLPMRAAAPDMLCVVGFGLKGRCIVGRTVMRKE